MSAGDPEDQTSEPSQWTRVSRKGKGNQSLPPAAGAPENFLPNPAPQLSPQDIGAHHQKIATKWRATDNYVKLCDTVRTNATSHIPITRAICLGLGAFDPEDGSWMAQRRSHIQMAAFLTVVEILSKTRAPVISTDVVTDSDAEKENNCEIACFYQEPRFAQPDKDFISSLHGKIVESPGSYDLIDEATLVFGVHLYRDIWADALQENLPGMFVGTGWHIWEQTPGSEKSSDFDRIREMDASFDTLPFPQDDHSSFSSTCIYWKKKVCDNDPKHDAAAPPETIPDTTYTEEPASEESQKTTTEKPQTNEA